MLSEKKLEAIKLLSENSMTVKAIAEKLEVSRGTVYYWMKDPTFQKKLQEMNSLKDQYLRQELKENVDQFIKRLEKLSISSKNDMVKLRAIEDLLMYAGWNDQQEIIIDTKKDNTNHLLELWKKKQQDNEQD